jgi:hypothetical protein
MLQHWKLALYHPSIPQNKAPYMTSLSKHVLEQETWVMQKKKETHAQGMMKKENERIAHV